MNTSLKKLGAFSLAMMSVAAIVNLRSLPLMASVGLNAVFFYLLAAITFLLPSSLVCAELAANISQAGGLYTWVKQALGHRAGFFAIWSEWFNNIISFPVTASFIATTLMYIINPAYVEHKYAVLITLLAILWGCTFYNFLGVVASSRLNLIGALLGVILPACVIILLGTTWLLLGKPVQLQLGWHAVLPEFKISNLVFFTGVLSSYAGMQIIAFHTPNVKEPRRSFPLAIAVATLLIFAITLCSALAIAIVVPTKQINLVSGVMEGFDYFFQAFNLPWARTLLAILIALSGISSLVAWLLGPARGLQVAARNGDFPVYFAKQSTREIPARILLLQVIISTLLAFLFVLMPSISVAFWLLMVLTSQFTLIMYILLFAAALKLKNTFEANNTFKIPGGDWGRRVVCGLAILVCAGAYLLGFFPPTQLPVPNLAVYEMIIIFGNLLYLAVPLLMMLRKK